MSNLTPPQILETAYQQALHQTSIALHDQQQQAINHIVENAETHKAVLAVLMTSLTKKIETPTQDIRQHKVELPGGYSGRSYDTQYITPFIHTKFPRLAMKESGWLTRSLEQVHAFTRDFPGKIRNTSVKQAFLEILDDVQTRDASAWAYLTALLDGLIQLTSHMQSIRVVAANPQVITVAQIIAHLDHHFHATYRVAGAARLPVIALYSIYQILMETPRYAHKQLAVLKGHTAADTKSRGIGDIEILNPDGTFFEAVEVKYQILITYSIAQYAYEKFQHQPVTRYYLLTTHEPNTYEQSQLDEFAAAIRAQHGCELIVNGVMPTLKYYLRLLPDITLFLSRYAQNLQSEYETSTDIKTVHLQTWLEINKRA